MLDPRNLGDANAQSALDCNLLNGDLRAWNGELQAYTPTKTGAINSIYFYEGQYWFHWLEQNVSVVKAPIAGDTSGRVVFTGVGVPKVTDNTIAVQGGNLYPMNAYDLGVPAPSVAPSAAGTANADPALNESRAYVCTYVTAWGEESAPSPASSIIDIDPDQTVNVTGLPTAPTGNYNVTTVRVYRTLDGDFYYVGEVSIGTTALADNVPGTTIAAQGMLATETWDMPPADLTGLIELPNGCLAGYSGNEFCMSEPYQPHAWPIANRYTMYDSIVGLGAFGNSVLITTTGAPVIATVGDPALASIEKIELEQSCVSSRGIVDIGYAVAYPTPDGLWFVGMGVNKNATESLFTIADWRALNPSSIHAYFHDGRYIAFYDATPIGGQKGCFILNVAGKEALTFSTLYADCGHVDRAGDALYLLVNGQVVKWGGSATKKPYTWRSKNFVAPVPMCPSVLQVIAKAYPVTASFFADGNLVHTQAIASRNPVRMPLNYRATDFEVEVSGVNDVHQILVANSVSELRGA